MKTRFNSITPTLISQRKSVHELCRQFSRSPSKGNLKRVKALFAHCGEEVFIEAGFHVEYGNNIYLGDRVYININCTLLDALIVTDTDTDTDTDYVISIGNDCLIGPNVQLLAVSHDMQPELRQTEKYNYIEKITLGNNVWLGGGVIVLAGVSIGENSVVGAGSVVTKDVEANSFYAGNPAVKIRNL